MLRITKLKQLIWFGFIGVVGYLVEISIINFAVGFGFGAILPRLAFKQQFWLPIT